MSARWSPDWCTAKLLALRASAEEDIASLWRRQPLAFLAFRICLLASLSFFLLVAGLRTGVILRTLVKYDKILMLYPQMVAIVIAFTLLTRKRLRDIPVLRWACFLTAIFFTGSTMKSMPNAPLLIWGIGSHGVLLLAFYLSTRCPPRWRAPIAVGVSVLILNGATYLTSGWSEFALVELTTPQRFAFLIYLAVLAYNLDRPGFRWGSYVESLCFPTQWIYPVPTLPSQWRTHSQDTLRLSARGYLDLAICGSFACAYYFTSRINIEADGLAKILLAGTSTYLSLYLFSCISISVPIAVMRVCGYEMPDAYEMPLLAASPQDRWRRWNTYFYQFYRWVFFVPLLKRSKSMFAAVILTFALTSCFHTYTDNIFRVPGGTLRFPLASEFYFFMLHGFAVYFGLVTRWSVFDGRRTLGWFGVALTWVLMILIHWAREIL